MNLRFCVWPALKLREKAISFEERGHRIWENFPIGPYNRNRLLCDCHYLVSHGTGVAVHALEPLNVSPSVLREQWRNATLATISSFYRCFFLLLDKWEGESTCFFLLLDKCVPSRPPRGVRYEWSKKKFSQLAGVFPGGILQQSSRTGLPFLD